MKALTLRIRLIYFLNKRGINNYFCLKLTTHGLSSHLSTFFHIYSGKVISGMATEGNGDSRVPAPVIFVRTWFTLTLTLTLRLGLRLGLHAEALTLSLIIEEKKVRLESKQLNRDIVQFNKPNHKLFRISRKLNGNEKTNTNTNTRDSKLFLNWRSEWVSECFYIIGTNAVPSLAKRESLSSPLLSPLAPPILFFPSPPSKTVSFHETFLIHSFIPSLYMLIIFMLSRSVPSLPRLQSFSKINNLVWFIFP